jgi:hypothetical protein
MAAEQLPGSPCTIAAAALEQIGFASGVAVIDLFPAQLNAEQLRSSLTPTPEDPREALQQHLDQCLSLWLCRRKATRRGELRR